MDKENKKPPTGEAYCPPGMTRSEYLSSPQFVKDLGEAMDCATQQAVAEHHAAGRSVWTYIEGKLVEVPPPQKAKKVSKDG